MRNMSFMATVEQVNDRTKTVTRRNGWLFLKTGDKVMACEKCQGLKKGEKIKKLGVLKVTSVTREPLEAITKEDCVKEGFPNMEPIDFIRLYMKINKLYEPTMVTRIEFEYEI